ncbi:MAG: MBL fold metallo-hydrolase [Candidatus Eremiobacteraeota bacterium]|nr:MBL fold metallo-hydrolase [Candidatus Eremiobacteraeota bacterium]
MKTLQLNSHYCQTYLVGEEGSRKAILIDPVLDGVDSYLAFLEKEGLALSHVIDTHTHADHISGAAVLADRTGCLYLMHSRSPAPCATMRLHDGSEFKVGALTARVIHTPGHTRDSICLVFPDRIFTGDTLFLDDGGAGRDDLPGGDAGGHWDSLEKIRALPGHLVVYPAHEYRNRKPSTLNEQKERNPHFKRRTREEFISFVEDLKLGPADWMKEVLAANATCARDPGKVWIPADLPSCEVKGTLEKNVNEQEVLTLSAADLKEKLERGETPFLLDVREARELTGGTGHLTGIVHIPIGSLARRLGELDHAKEREILTICHSGGRAHTAAQMLALAGFHKVRKLEGGMMAWHNEGYTALYTAPDHEKSAEN